MTITKASRGSFLRAEAGAWEPVEYHRIDEVEVAVARRGRGVPVVCLHAIAHGARDFEPLAERVGDAAEIIAVDWPGQGRSGPAREPASAASYASLLERLLPQLSDEPVVLLGCSIGGAVAIQLAARRPDLVRALVLCNSGGLLAVDRLTRAATRAMSTFFRQGARGAWWYGGAFGLYYRLVLAETAAAAQRERIVAAAYETAAPLAEAWASFGRPEADLRGLIPQIRQPTLFAWTTGDRILPWSRHAAAARLFPDHRIELFRGGHAAFLEDPQRFAEAFRVFLGDLKAAPQPRFAETA